MKCKCGHPNWLHFGTKEKCEAVLYFERIVETQIDYGSHKMYKVEIEPIGECPCTEFRNIYKKI